MTQMLAFAKWQVACFPGNLIRYMMQLTTSRRTRAASKQHGQHSCWP